MSPAGGGTTLLRPIQILHGLAAAAAPLLVALTPEPGLGIGMALMLVVGITGLLRPGTGALSCCVLAVQIPVICAIRLAGGWPCDIACQGGAAYLHLLGIPVLWPAMVAYVLLAGLVIRDAWRGRWSRLLVDWTALLGGISAFFLATAWGIGLFCPFCVSIHLSMVLLLACLRPQPERGWWQAVLAFLLGALGLALAYRYLGHVGDIARPDIQPVNPTLVPLRESAAYVAIDRGRRRGPADAPYRIDLIVDPHCELCAQEYDALVRTLRPLTEGKEPRLCLVTSFLIRSGDRAAADLDRHLLAAAALGPATFRAVLDVALGSDTQADFTALSSRIAEVEDPLLIQRTWTADQAVIDLVLDDDARTQRELDAGPASPQVILTAQRAGVRAALAHWSGRIDIASMVQDIEARMAAGVRAPRTP